MARRPAAGPAPPVTPANPCNCVTVTNSGGGGAPVSGGRAPVRRCDSLPLSPQEAQYHYVTHQMSEANRDDENAQLLGEEGLQAAGQSLKLG